MSTSAACAASPVRTSESPLPDSAEAIPDMKTKIRLTSAETAATKAFSDFREGFFVRMPWHHFLIRILFIRAPEGFGAPAKALCQDLRQEKTFVRRPLRHLLLTKALFIHAPTATMTPSRRFAKSCRSEPSAFPAAAHATSASATTKKRQGETTAFPCRARWLGHFVYLI